MTIASLGFLGWAGIIIAVFVVIAGIFFWLMPPNLRPNFRLSFMNDGESKKDSEDDGDNDAKTSDST